LVNKFPIEAYKSKGATALEMCSFLLLLNQSEESFYSILLLQRNVAPLLRVAHTSVCDSLLKRYRYCNILQYL